MTHKETEFVCVLFFSDESLHSKWHNMKRIEVYSLKTSLMHIPNRNKQENTRIPIYKRETKGYIKYTLKKKKN